MFSSSTKICLFFLSIFILFELNNGDCKGYGAKCSGRGKGNCCAGTCSGTCCINGGGGCNGDSDKRCCPGTKCTAPGEVGHDYRCE
ncbi:unnamed protein product [Meloidogyne enterolobii]|uniref:Uncharacterized protein n=2 Tax=Meloidogyne enterolobii TaxID=390850 RepID=A0ACB0Z5L9_MELEN|nr:unnamed protein product [Meloidogyne enterolobii]